MCCSSDSIPSQRALAPVATMTASGAVLVVADPDPERLLREVDASVTSSVTYSAPNRSACRRKSDIISGPHDPVGVAGIVLDVARDHQLAAPGEALDHEGLQVGARGVQRGRIAGGATADDDQLTDVLVAQRSAPLRKSVCSSKRDRAAGCSSGIEPGTTGKDGSHDLHRHRQRPARPFGLPGGERLRDQPLYRPGSIVDRRPRRGPRRSSTLSSPSSRKRPSRARHPGVQARAEATTLRGSGPGGTASSTGTDQGRRHLCLVRRR